MLLEVSGTTAQSRNAAFVKKKGEISRLRHFPAAHELAR
jgi:hypothetical protein